MTDLKLKEPDLQLQKLDIEDQLSCPICTNTYYNPVTLLCQHTFCYHCISDEKIKECPVCRIKKFIPIEAVEGKTDNILSEITNLYYGKDSMNKIKEEVDDYLEDKRMRPEIEKQLKAKLLVSLNNLAIKYTKKKKLNVYASTIHVQQANDFVPYEPQISESPYVKYMKYGLLILLCFGFGYVIGRFIMNVFSYCRGRCGFDIMMYSGMRLIGIFNLLYQYGMVIIKPSPFL